MYRLLLIIILLNVVDCRTRCKGPNCQNKGHRRAPNRNPEESFHKLAHQTISTEKKFENFCRYNMYARVREVYGTDSYVLKYSIEGFQAKDVIVKILHKAIYIAAERWDPTGLKSFKDVKMLPDNLNSEDGSWSLQDGELAISFPYKTPIGTEIRKSCGNLNYSMVTLTMANPVVSGKASDVLSVPVSQI